MFDSVASTNWSCGTDSPGLSVGGIPPRGSEPVTSSSGGWIIAAAAAAAAVFGVDLLLPLGYAVPMLYVLPILLTGLLPGRQSTLLVVGGVLLLTWLGVPLSPGELTPEALTNRAMGSALLLAIGWLLFIHKESVLKITAAQQARDESEERFALAFRTSPHPIGITEVATGCCIEVNDACLQLFGFCREEVIGNTTLMLGIWPNPEDRDRLIERVKAGEPVRDLEFTFKTKSGDLRHIQVSSDLVELRGTLCLITIGNDITARKRVEDALRQVNETLEQRVVERTAALREAEERFRGIFQHAAEGIAVTDLEGRFVRCNAAYAAIVGYPEHELTTMQFSSLLHPEDRLRHMEYVRRLLSGEIPSFRVENRYHTKSDRNAWVQTHVSILRNDQGVPTHLLALVTDITKHKQMETVLRTVQARQHLLLTATPVVLYTCRITGSYGTTFISENVKEQLGYSAQDFTADAEFWLGHLHPDDRQWVLMNLVQALRQERQVQEYRFLHQDGTYRWLHDESRLLRDPAGVPVELVGFQIDITDQKLVEEELRRQQVELESLTAKLLAAQETERRRLARELHDDITQRLALLAIDLQSLRPVRPGSEESLIARVHRSGQMAEQIATDVQHMAHQLHPSLLEHAGLEEALYEHVEEFETRTGLKTNIQVRRLPIDLSLEHATCLYRVLQESLQNVRKHANATSVLVRLLGTKRGVGLCVHDDGRGFVHPPARGGKRMGIGIISMEERVGALCGTLRIKTKPGDGTEVHAWVPLDGCTVTTDGGASR